MAIWYLNYLKENIMEKEKKAWHTYRRDNRYAEVHRNSNGFYVDLYENNQLKRTQEAYKHSESWAESIAENWVDGIL